jgi:catechol 2,3-dioxygenase-like lactoylglutathione lyase family enzyme
MIGYVTLGTNDIARAAEFYDSLLGELAATPFTRRPSLWGLKTKGPPDPEARVFTSDTFATSTATNSTRTSWASSGC